MRRTEDWGSAGGGGEFGSLQAYLLKLAMASSARRGEHEKHQVRLSKVYDPTDQDPAITTGSSSSETLPGSEAIPVLGLFCLSVKIILRQSARHVSRVRRFGVIRVEAKMGCPGSEAKVIELGDAVGALAFGASMPQFNAIDGKYCFSGFSFVLLQGFCA